MADSLTTPAELVNQIPMPPVDMQMPATANNAYIAVSYAALLVVAVLFAREWRKTGLPVALLALAGGALAFFLEPAFDIVALVWYPQYGQTPLFRAFNYAIPAWMLPAYALYMGAQGYWVSKALQRGLSQRALVGMFLAFWVTNAIVEMPGLSLGIYTYYGPQPFKLLGFPLWMAMVNSIVPMMIGVMLYGMAEFLRGARALLIVPLLPMIIAAVEAGLGWPVWLTLNMGQGLLLTHAAALFTLCLSLISLGLIGHYCCTRTANASRLRKAVAA